MSDVLDLLRSLEWYSEHPRDGTPLCPVCRRARPTEGNPSDGHTPDCRLDRAIRGLASSAIEEVPEPTVDEMAIDLDLTRGHLTRGPSRWVSRSSGVVLWQEEAGWYRMGGRGVVYPSDEAAMRAMWEEQRSSVDEMARQVDATLAGKRVGPWLTPPAPKTYEASGPPTDPSALAAWLYARVMPGHTVVEWTEPSVDRIHVRKAFVSAVQEYDGYIVLWAHEDSALCVPPPVNYTHRATKLVNPDGTVLWEAK